MDSKGGTTLLRTTNSTTGTYSSQDLLLDKWHLGISSTGTKGRTTLLNINKTTGKYCSIAFI